MTRRVISGGCNLLKLDGWSPKCHCWLGLNLSLPNENSDLSSSSQSVFGVKTHEYIRFWPQVAQLPLDVRDGRWHHICMSWTTRDGQWDAYQDGEKLGSGDNLAAWHPIKPGGVIILGQEQVTTTHSCLHLFSHNCITSVMIKAVSRPPVITSPMTRLSYEVTVLTVKDANNVWGAACSYFQKQNTSKCNVK